MFPAAVERWRALASAEAARWGAYYGVAVPADTVLALIQKESSGNPRAKRTEPDGRVSRGLLQVLEGTAHDMGLADPLQLFTPAVGIATGTKYFAKQVKRYGGNVPHAIAAYNAGSAKFNQDETYKNQGYVTKVLAFIRSATTGAAAGTIAAARKNPAAAAGIVLALVILGAIAASGATRERRAA